MRRLPCFDNIRSFIIYGILIPYHLCCAFSIYVPFYLHGGDSPYTALFLLMTRDWIMPLLFLVSGIFAARTLKRKPAHTFLFGRIKRLLLPLVCGVLFINVWIGYAEYNTLNHLSLTLPEYFSIYYSHPETLWGVFYEGDGMTVAHLWFILVLFTVSFILTFLKKPLEIFSPGKYFTGIIPLILLFLPLLPASALFENDLNIPQVMVMFFYGVFILSDDIVLETVKKKEYLLLLLSMISLMITVILCAFFSSLTIPIRLLRVFNNWTVPLSVISLFMNHGNAEGKLSPALRSLSFLFYILHQPVLALSLYLLKNYIHDQIFLFMLTLIMTYPLTLVLTLIVSRIPGLRFLLGYVPSQKKNCIKTGA